MREHLNGSEHLYIFVSFFTLLVSESVFGTIQRGLACPCANVDNHQSRSVVKLCVAQFLRFCVSFSSGDGIFCIVVASHGHVSLIVDQLDWQCCRSPLLHRCGLVLGSLASRCEPSKLSSSMLSSDRFTQTSQYSHSCRTRGGSQERNTVLLILRVSWLRSRFHQKRLGAEVTWAGCAWRSRL